MAGSGTGTVSTAAGQLDYSINCVEIIKDALKSIGVLGTGQTLQANEQSDALRALNLIVKQLMGPPSYMMKGFKPWQLERTTLTLTGKALFELKSSGGDLDISIPVNIISARLVDSDDNETMLDKLTLDQYDAIPNKAEENTPQAFYYERRIDSGYFYLDCIPSDTSNYTIDITYLQEIARFENVRTTTDFPKEWHRVLKFALAVDLGPEYGADISNVKVLRDEAIAIATTFKTDENFYFFQPGCDE